MDYNQAKLLARELRKNQTRAETYFWNRVRNRKFLNLKFTRQFPIEYTLLEHKKYFIADFYCHEKKLIIEIDGTVHLNSKDYDDDRTNILIKRGYSLIRFSNEDVLENWHYIKSELSKFLLP